MTGFGLCRYFRQQRRALPEPRADGVCSQTILITGTNVGLGFEASIHLAKMDPRLLIATSRNLDKCEETRRSILQRVGAGHISSVSTWSLELGSFQNVLSVVDKFETFGNGTMNAFVANAGVLAGDNYSQTQDGWEVTLQVNYLSTALLSILLLPALINSSEALPDSPSRVVIVSSFAHHFVPEVKQADSWSNILDTINRRDFTSKRVRYSVSKLLQVVFVRELASRLPQPTPVIVCAVDPGYCESGIRRSQQKGPGWYSSVVKTLFLVRSTEEGSRALVHAAVSSDHSMHGRYVESCRVSDENEFLFTPKGKAFSARVWDETITLLSGIDSRVSEIVGKYLQVDNGNGSL